MRFSKTSSREWILTKEAFDRFLGILDEDRAKAGEKYESIRLKLLKYFEWCESEAPDIDADETINRVVRRIDEGANVYNLSGYIHGVAKVVRIESLRRQNMKEQLDEELLNDLPESSIDSQAARCLQCLQRCLGYLSDEDREVITEYYKHDKAERIAGRKRLAVRLGVSLKTLRVKTHRQRVNLEACVEECLRKY